MANLVPWVCIVLLGAEPKPALSPSDVVAALETAVADAIARAEFSVVAIARTKGENGDVTTAIRGRNPAPVNTDPRTLSHQGNFAPGRGEYVSFDFGSGVVVGEHGEILTTLHVVKGAERIEVRAVDRQYFEAEIIAADPRSDLAVIVPRQIPGVAPPRLRPIALGDAHDLRRGTFLVALGNPFNAAHDGKPSASWGILSNVARRLEPSIEDSQMRKFQLRHYPTLLQLDAKLNLGMSGGAVINLRSESWSA